MNETTTPMFYRNSGSTGWPHNYPNQDLYTFERHFIYEFAKTSLYEWQKQLGMLSPYAEVYNLPTDKSERKQNTNEKETSTTGKDQEEKSTPEQNNDTKSTAKYKNEETNQDNNTVRTKEKKSKQEKINIIEEDWVQVKQNAKTKEVREAIQTVYINNVKNYYAALKEDEEGVDEKDDIKKESVVNETAEEHRKTVNVNDLTIDEMVQYINDYKKNDAIVTIPEETKNKKKNCSDSHKKYSNQSGKIKEETEKNINVESDSEMEEETEDEDSFTDDNDLNNDDIDSDDELTIRSTDEESSDGEKLESDVNEEEDNLKENEERDKKMEQLLYQNDLLLFRLEQAELNEEKLREELYFQTKAKNDDTNQEVIKIQKQLKDKEEELKNKVNEYEHKIETVEKALAVKTKQLIEQLRRRK